MRNFFKNEYKTLQVTVLGSFASSAVYNNYLFFKVVIVFIKSK